MDGKPILFFLAIDILTLALSMFLVGVFMLNWHLSHYTGYGHLKPEAMEWCALFLGLLCARRA